MGDGPLLTFSFESVMLIHKAVTCAGSGVVRIDPLLFPGQMSYKVTKPGLVLFYILACFNCIVAY